LDNRRCNLLLCAPNVHVWIHAESHILRQTAIKSGGTPQTQTAIE
jgi:hypothetical protein